MSDESTAEDGGSAGGGILDTGGTARDRLLQASLVVLGLLAVIALVQFYTSMGAVIREWVAPRYEPLFQAGFNLAVFLLAAIGISVTLRTLRRPSG